jgi:cytidine deaminase
VVGRGTFGRIDFDPKPEFHADRVAVADAISHAHPDTDRQTVAHADRVAIANAISDSLRHADRVAVTDAIAYADAYR